MSWRKVEEKKRVCGINGILQLHASQERIVQPELLKTRDYMTLRGPDACGEWVSPSGEIGLGHRRLAIIDLSPGGNQPMSQGTAVTDHF
jgi:asparagine synthase (glutamine-hydrolysing)